ncbi:hypothetical protein BASA81_000988 [Batrachochytrium salamandrivorans]|nr:hypothetical protein BASA81_000988 [Batrachochytrium salamandrivorans]
MSPSSNTTMNATLTGCNAPSEHSASDFDQNSWVIAICLAILAAVSNNLGVNFQKLAWTQRQTNKASISKFRVVWTMGMLGIILASVFDFVALAFGPQSVIAPIGALTIVMNGCVASYLHGERVTRMIVCTSLVICAGCALAVATASHTNVICDLDGIYAYFSTTTFAGYCVFMVVVLLAGEMFTRKAERIHNKFGECSAEYARVFPYHRVSYAFLAGLNGSVSVVFARAIGQLVMSSSRGGQLFLVRWETYLLLVGLVFAIVMQMINLNKGLSRFESSYNVPTFTGTFIVAVAVSGGVVYGEFAHFSLLSSILFPIGVFLCVLGVFALTWNSTKMTSTESDVPVSGADRESGNDQISPIPEVPLSYEIKPPVVTRTMRIHSGGFSPFAISLEQSVLDTSSTTLEGGGSRKLHRSSLHNRHHVDLLTGLNMAGFEEAYDSPSHRGRGGGHKPERTTPTPTPRNSATTARVVMLNPIVAGDLPGRQASPALRVPSPANATTMAQRSTSPVNSNVVVPHKTPSGKHFD